METLSNIQIKSDEEILAEIKKLNAEISRRRCRETKKNKPRTEEQLKRGRPKKTDEPKQVEPMPTEQLLEPPPKAERPRTDWRHKENGKYDNHAVDPEYYKNYWREHYRKPYTCDICNTNLLSSGSGILKHKRTMRCQLAKLKQETGQSN